MILGDRDIQPPEPHLLVPLGIGAAFLVEPPGGANKEAQQRAPVPGQIGNHAARGAGGKQKYKKQNTTHGDPLVGPPSDNRKIRACLGRGHRFCQSL